MKCSVERKLLENFVTTASTITTTIIIHPTPDLQLPELRNRFLDNLFAAFVKSLITNDTGKSEAIGRVESTCVAILFLSSSGEDSIVDVDGDDEGEDEAVVVRQSGEV